MRLITIRIIFLKAVIDMLLVLNTLTRLVRKPILWASDQLLQAAERRMERVEKLLMEALNSE